MYVKIKQIEKKLFEMRLNQISEENTKFSSYLLENKLNNQQYEVSFFHSLLDQLKLFHLFYLQICEINILFQNHTNTLEIVLYYLFLFIFLLFLFYLLFFFLYTYIYIDDRQNNLDFYTKYYHLQYLQTIHIFYFQSYKSVVLQ